MPTLDDTVGGTAANTYVLQAAATTFFDERLDTEGWDDATSDDQIRALIQAARRMNQLAWRGKRTSTTQALAWPRSGVTDQDGTAYGTADIPTEVEHAQMNLALDMLGTDLLADDGLAAFDRVKIGPLDIEPSHQAAGSLPDNVEREVGFLLVGTPSGPKLVRG
jgi:hypothetical protein